MKPLLVEKKIFFVDKFFYLNKKLYTCKTLLNHLNHLIITLIMAKVNFISEAAAIGINSMLLLAHSKESLNVVNIGEILNASRHHVAKVLQILSKQGYLKSIRGVSGGFTLKKEPREISFIEIFETVEGPLEVVGVSENQTIPFQRHLIDAKVKNLTRDFIRFLKKYNLENYPVKFKSNFKLPEKKPKPSYRFKF